MGEDYIDKNKPIVILKPTSAEAVGGNLYRTRESLYYLSLENIKKLIDFLNQFRLDIPSGVSSIDKRLPISKLLHKSRNVKLEEAERMAIDNNCNILGGMFLAFINSFGIKIGQRVFKIKIRATDMDFLQTLYPDISGYFNSPRELTEKQIEYAEGVIKNNTGELKVVEIDHDIRIFPEEVLKKLSLLKNVFRYAAKSTIPYDATKLRCSLIHSPEIAQELEDNISVINSKIKAQK